MGQARKSLWIETVKRIGESFGTKVRLVRACGSKHFILYVVFTSNTGQARKSLWIETISIGKIKEESKVRLVRACGSKLMEEAGVGEVE